MLPKCHAAVGDFLVVYGCTAKRWPREMNASFDFFFEDPTVKIRTSVKSHTCFG